MLEKDEVLARERAFNEAYLSGLKQQADREATAGPLIAVPRNLLWADGYVVKRTQATAIGPIAGRTELATEDEDLGFGFYVGPGHAEIDGTMVVSFAAPMAALFFDRGGPDRELIKDLVARRAFEPQRLDVVDFDDEFEAGMSPNQSRMYRSERELNLGSTPAGPVARPSRRKEEEEPRPATKPSEPSAGSDSSGTQRATPDPVLGLRNERLVRRAVEKPRTGDLSPVLATLQPDQYELVTAPTAPTLILQGGPGTGKTIVATHRAAFLGNDQRPGGALDRIALVGPTASYVDHIRPVIADLGAQQRVDLFSLADLMQSSARIEKAPAAGPPERLDTSWAVGLLLDRAHQVLAAELRQAGDARPSAQRLVDRLLGDAGFGAGLVEGDEELQSWLTRGRSWDHASRSTNYAAFLAAARLLCSPLPEANRYQHVLVDEAQDVRPLEWRVIQNLLAKGGSMTLLGDVQQRRVRWTPHGWQALSGLLGLAGRHSPAISELSVGFRSTRQIIQFAGRLLDNGPDAAAALMDGPEPSVVRTGKRKLTERVAETATDLSTKHPSGVVCVISAEPEPIKSALRSNGWERQPEGEFRRDGQRIQVRDPESARGLEFDGVVVVEPSELVPESGWMGPLYTSLTRATKELVVVHCERLPDELRSKSPASN